MTISARRLPIFLAVLFTSFSGISAHAEAPQLTSDGWHTWRVTAADNASDWCCFQWNSGVSKQKSCDLDDRRNGYSNSSDNDTIVNEMQIYVLTSGGKPEKIRALSSQCRVTSKSEISDLGVFESDDSIDWLQQHIDPHSEISSDAMAAISTHDGDRPISVLMDVVRDNSSIENRKDALFWLAMSDSDTAYEFLDRLLSKN
jgi:hypothetical protein